MKVLLSDTWASGGASTFVAQLGPALASRGHNVDVIVGYRASHAVEEYASLVRAVHLPPTNFTQLALDQNYDIVHVTEGDLEPPFDYVRRIRRLPIHTGTVVTVHTSGAVLSSTADATCFVSRYARESAIVAANTTVHVVPNGITIPDPFTPEVPPGNIGRVEPIVVWVGRIEETERQKDFVGFAYMIKSLLDSGMKVVIFDSSPPAKDYPAGEQIFRWFGPMVTYHNQAPRMTVLRTLSAAGRTGGALISTSRTEAFPFAALEAASLGCRVLAPAIPPFSELFESGIAIPYGSLGDLLAAAGDVSNQDAPTLPMEWSVNSMADTYEEIYASILTRDQHNGALMVPTKYLFKWLAHARAKSKSMTSWAKR